MQYSRSLVIGALSCGVLAIASGNARAEDALPRVPTVVTGTAKFNSGVLRTAAEAATVLLPSGARLELSNNSEIRVFPVPQKLQLSPGARTTTWSFVLLRGRTDVSVPKKSRNAVLANVGRLAALVMNGEATVLATADEQIVSNQTGFVRTLLGTQWQTVNPGEFSLLSKASPDAATQPGLPAPVLESERRVWIAADDPVAIQGLHWKPVANASGYDLALESADQSRLGFVHTSATTLASALARVVPGSYMVRARSVDTRGIQGPWSAGYAVRVVGVELPAGAYIARDTIFINPEQQVRFTNTDGLEMTYIGAGRYFPPTEAVGLYRKDTTRIAFRVPGESTMAIARLEPRTVFAKVEVGPKKAIWPKDPIAITIQLQTQTGDPVPSWLEAVPKVRLGLQPLDVQFTREGNVLRGTVQPQANDGPWVLRVDVEDQYGTDLGRDFVEITPKRLKRRPVIAKRPAKMVNELPRSERGNALGQTVLHVPSETTQQTAAAR